MKVHEALAKVMDEVRAVEKRDRNTHQNFSFRGVDAVVNAVGPVLRKHGVVVMPSHRERRRHDRTLEWAETVLRNWLDAEIAADDSKKPRKSRELPSGVTVKRISGRPSLAVDDEAALVDWLKDHRPDLVEAQVKWVWSKTDVRKLAGDDGTIRVVDEETGEVSHAPASVKVGEDRYTVEVGR